LSKESGSVAQIKTFILNELKQGPLRRSVIIKRTLEAVSNSNANTITGTIHQLMVEGKIHSQVKGVWILGTVEPDTSFAGEIEQKRSTDRIKDKKNKPFLDEKNFYEPFASWLIDEDECTYAIALGGNEFRDKWGTPDVIGIYRVDDRARYKGDEIVTFVSAEIKSDPSQPFTALGQACAYLGFSHKVYLVLPNIMSERDTDRIETLANIIGLGLVLFDPSNKNTDFKIRQRPAIREPDASALNEILDKENIFRKLK
jgi:hypothetical protein